MSEIVFIHGMFQNPKSWSRWVEFFEARGHRCHAPAWPLHEGEPADLRIAIPPGTGELTLDDLNAAIRSYLIGLDEPPVLIGHSLGGLITQVLLNEGRAAAGVAICPVAPNAMLSFEWSFLKNCTTILNPLMGDAPQEMDAEMFHAAFANVMPGEASNRAWRETAVHESRNVLRTALGRAGHVDITQPHAPLLLIGAAEDRIIPPSLVVKNFEAYEDSTGVVNYHEFANHGHFICGEPGWEKVAGYVADWVESGGAGEVAPVGGGVAEAVQ